MKVFAKKEYKDKSSKNGPLEGLELMEYLEQIHQDPIVIKSQRGLPATEKLNLEQLKKV